MSSSWYPSFLKNVFEGNVSVTSSFKSVLLDGYSFNPLHETYEDVLMFESSDSLGGYTLGGKETNLSFRSGSISSWLWDYPSWENIDLSTNGLAVYSVGVEPSSSYLCQYVDFKSNYTTENKFINLSRSTDSSDISNFNLDVSGLVFDSSVTCTIPDGKGGVFIGGDFSSVQTSNGTFSRLRLCQINRQGEVTSFDPISSLIDIQSDVTTLAMDYDGGFLYVGLNNLIDYVTVRTSGATTANRYLIFRVNIETGFVDNWNPGSSGYLSGDAILSLDFIPEQKRIIASGIWSNESFGGRTGTSRLIMLAADPLSTTSTAVSGFPTDSGGTLTYPSSTVYSVKWEPSLKKIYVGGTFTNYDGLADHDYVIRFHADPDNPSTYGRHDTTWTPRPNNQVRTIEALKELVYLGGSFSSLGSENILYIGRVNTSNGDPDPNWKDLLGGSVYFILLSGEYLYCAGSMTNPANDIFRLKTRETSNIIDFNWNTESPTVNIGFFTSNRMCFLFDKLCVTKGSSTVLFGGQVYSQTSRFALLER